MHAIIGFRKKRTDIVALRHDFPPIVGPEESFEILTFSGNDEWGCGHVLLMPHDSAHGCWHQHKRSGPIGYWPDTQHWHTVNVSNQSRILFYIKNTPILLRGSITGASMNPARSLGPNIVGQIFLDSNSIPPHFWSYHYIYWAGPFMGATVVVAIYR